MSSLGGRVIYGVKPSPRTGKPCPFVIYTSQAHSGLNDFYEKTYCGKPKHVELSSLNELQPLAVAVWFADDGALGSNKSSFDLHTEGFSYDENQLIASWFMSRFLINVKVKKRPDQNGFFLWFASLDARRLREIVLPFLHPTMQYKICLSIPKKPRQFTNPDGIYRQRHHKWLRRMRQVPGFLNCVPRYTAQQKLDKSVQVQRKGKSSWELPPAL